MRAGGKAPALPRHDVLAARLDQQPRAFAAQRPRHASGDVERAFDRVRRIEPIVDALDQPLLVAAGQAAASQQRIRDRRGRIRRCAACRTPPARTTVRSSMPSRPRTRQKKYLS